MLVESSSELRVSMSNVFWKCIHGVLPNLNTVQKYILKIACLVAAKSVVNTEYIVFKL